MNYNFHDSAEANVQRLLNALEPGTQLPIHRHQHTEETYVLLRGRIKVMYYDDHGTETDNVMLDPNGSVYGIHIPAGQWHSLEVLEPGSVIFEVKEGPYTPLAANDMLLQK
jgi:cupin fold WbuC family metalloprotein